MPKFDKFTQKFPRSQKKYAAIEKLAIKYAPNDIAAGREKAIKREWKNLCVLEMDIEHMTGKEAIELVKDREQTE